MEISHGNETDQGRAAGHRNGRRRNVSGPAAQPGGDRPPRGARDHARRWSPTRRLDKARAIVGDAASVTGDAFEVVKHPEIDIVVELIGGTSIARELVLQAIESGKQVVTANKALLATHGNEIFSAAQRKGVTVAFEAAVAGGVPIIKALREGLSANRIEWIAGIINGTSNFILSEMRDKGKGVRRGARGSAAARLCRGRPDVRYRRGRRRAQAHHHGGDRLRHADAVRCVLHRRHLPSSRARTSATPKSSATGSSCSASPSAPTMASSCAFTPR